MKTILLGAAALALMAAPAFAQTDTSTVTVNATVAPMCELSTPGSQVFNINMIPANAGSIVDADGTLKAQTSQPVLLSAFAGGVPTAWCNGTASTVTLEADGLTNPAAADADGDFVNYIDLALEGWEMDGTSLGDVETVGGNADSTGPVLVGAFSGGFDGNIRFVDTGKKLVAGTYTGAFTLTIAAAG